MTYSYTQISQYLSCPRRYKHRYLDGWTEKNTRAAMLDGLRALQTGAPKPALSPPVSACRKSGSRARTLGATPRSGL